MKLSSGKISYKCIHYNLRGVNNVYQASFHKTMIMPFTFIYTYTYKHNKRMKNGYNVSGAFDSHNFFFYFRISTFLSSIQEQTNNKKYGAVSRCWTLDIYKFTFPPFQLYNNNDLVRLFIW